MARTRKAEQTTTSGTENTKQASVRLPDLPNLQLGELSEQDAFNATDEEFLEFLQTLVPIEAEDGASLHTWTWVERAEWLNMLIDDGVLIIRDGRLVPNPEIQEETRTSTPENMVYSSVEPPE